MTVADVERESLRARYGRPVRITDEVQVRALLDLRARAELGSGRKVAVFRYPSVASAEAYKEFNRLRFPGTRVLGPYDTVLGPVCVLDLGPADRRVAGHGG